MWDIRWLIYSSQDALSLSQVLIDTHQERWVDSELIHWVEENNVKRVVSDQPDFPYKCTLIKQHPRILYYMGDISLLERPILAIVGPRSHSAYAVLLLEDLFSIADRYECCTISWLAIGVDQMCHRMSIKKGIPTIAVLWWGIRRYLNSWDRGLIQDIVAHGGLVLSEYRLHQQPTHYTFPQRNRIIAWLSDCVFLPEAGEKSGSLITATYALEMKKIVYWAPNNIFVATSTWVNQLISSWKIYALTDIKTIFSTFPTKNKSKNTIITSALPLSKQEQEIVSIIWKTHPCTITDILAMSSNSVQETISFLTLLEMKKYIYQETPDTYSISRGE